jgi:hypothetical protein
VSEGRVRGRGLVQWFKARILARRIFTPALHIV